MIEDLRPRLKVLETGAKMVPAGYMYKQVRPPTDYIKAPNVIDVCSAGECGSQFSPSFCDDEVYFKYWWQNGFSFFNRPEIMREMAQLESIDLSDMTLFYYEIYQLECHYPDWESEELEWMPARYEAEESGELFKIDVLVPKAKRLIGYDALAGANLSSSNCSMLACCNLAEEFSVNSHCLFDTIEDAKKAIETGRFHESEDLAQRIIAVYIVEQES